MKQRIYTGSEAMTLKIPVTTKGEQNIRVIVKDSEQENTILTDVIKTVNGQYNFFVMMPLCRKYVDLIIVNDDDGSDNGFTYNGKKGKGKDQGKGNDNDTLQKMHLIRRMNDIDFSSYKLKEYIRFIQQFCYNCGVLAVNDPKKASNFYHSDGKNFWIKYLPVIINAETGQEEDTPARIAQDGSFIEVSQKYFINYTVPMRMAVLLHEYSHPFINKNPNDETEADLNGLFIYLALGYPRMEGGQAWCDVAYNSPTEENVQRVEMVTKFIEHFDNTKMVIYK